MRLLVIGIILSLVIFLPRIIPLLKQLPSDTPSETGQVATATKRPVSYVSVGGTVATTGSAIVDSIDSSVDNLPSSTAVAASAGGLGQEVAMLKERVKTLEDSLTKQKELHKEFIVTVKKKFGFLLVQQQMSDYKTLAASGSFKVPAWAVPWCHKATLNANDLMAFYKLGVGMIRPSDDKQPKELVPSLKEMFLFYLNKMKLSSLRLYRESPEHAGKLGDMVPPEDRAAKSPAGLPVSSIHLNGTLQCIYSVDVSGKLKIKGALYSIPRGKLVHKCVKSGNDYQQVIEALAREFAGLSEKLAAEVDGGK